MRVTLCVAFEAHFLEKAHLRVVDVHEPAGS